MKFKGKTVYNTLKFKNLDLPVQIIKESIGQPEKIRFRNTPELLKVSRTFVIALAMRCSFILSLLALYFTGRTIKYYPIFVLFVFLTANSFSAISLSISCGLRNLMSKLVFKEDNFNSIVHPLAMAYLINIIPL